ncbi:hypothetical protein FAX13_08520 [Ligilactobacillus animalis]|nr:hypothetical protein FAX13_08520 [Ligilactobacillus animalis]
MSKRTKEEIVADNNKRKDKIVELLNSAELYYTQKGDQNTVKNIQIQKKNLAENKFSIVVVGEFSAGKSTLLNAMMGKRMLPSFTQETTATVNFLRDKSEAPNDEAGIVYYTNGTKEVIPDTELKTIEKYVSTKGNEVASNVDHLDVYFDSKFLKDGVTLVDSPGLNGVAEGHKEITENQIKQSNASIFMFDASRPGSQTDFDSLGNLQENVSKIFILLNKIDMIREEEEETIEDVKQGLAKSYMKVFPDAKKVPEIYAISAGNALKAREKGEGDTWGLDEFETKLFEFMSSDKKYVEQLKSPVKQIDSLVNNSIQSLNENKELLESKADTEELHQKINKLTSEIEAVDTKDKDSRRSINSKLNAVFRDATNEIRVETQKYIERNLKRVKEYSDPADLGQYLENFETNFTRKLRTIVENGKYNLQASIEDIVVDQYVEQSLAINDKLDGLDVFSEVNINEKFELPTNFGEVGLEQMRAEKAALEDRLLALKKKRADAEENLAIARANERERKRLEEVIETKKQHLDMLEVSFSENMPKIHRNPIQTAKEIDRGGFFGKIGDALFGKKKMFGPGWEVDSTEHDEYIARNSKRLDERRAELEKDFVLLREKENTNMDVAETRADIAKEELNEAKAKFEKLMQEQDAKLDSYARKQLNSLQNHFYEYCDNTLDDVIRNIKKNMNNAKKQYAGIIVEMVNANIDQKLKKKKSYLESLESQLESSEDDKKERLAEIASEMEQLTHILEQVTVLENEINGIEVAN